MTKKCIHQNNVDGYVIRNELVVKLLGLYTDDLFKLMFTIFAAKLD